MLQLFDRQGRLLARYRMDLSAGENQQRLDVESLASGTYFMQLLVEGQPVPARKFLVNR